MSVNFLLALAGGAIVAAGFAVACFIAGFCWEMGRQVAGGNP